MWIAVALIFTFILGYSIGGNVNKTRIDKAITAVHKEYPDEVEAFYNAIQECNKKYQNK